MVEIFEYEDYRRYLGDYFKQVTEANSRVSLRSFAKRLGLHPPVLCDVLKFKKGISVDTAIQISNKLNLTSEQTDFFNLLVLKSQVKSEAAKENFERQLRDARRSQNTLTTSKTDTAPVAPLEESVTPTSHKIFYVAEENLTKARELLDEFNQKAAAIKADGPQKHFISIGLEQSSTP